VDKTAMVQTIAVFLASIFCKKMKSYRELFMSETVLKA